MSERTGGFVMDLHPGQWLITSVPAFAHAPSILAKCGSEAECAEKAPRYGRDDLVFIEVAKATHWKAPR